MRSESLLHLFTEKNHKLGGWERRERLLRYSATGTHTPTVKSTPTFSCLGVSLTRNSTGKRLGLEAT